MDGEVLLEVARRFGLADRERVADWAARLELEQALFEELARTEVASDRMPIDLRSGLRDAPPPPGKGVAEEPVPPRIHSGSVEERVEVALVAIEAHSDLNAFTCVFADEARDQARALDARSARGEDTGPLTGWTVAVKDLIDVKGYATTGGTRALQRQPAAADAPAVARLREAGAVVVGMANLHALAYGALSTSSDAGAVGNPLLPEAIAGGSSGGSAAAVGAGLVDVALGTDTAGSIRIPAAHCGVVGLKGTYGVVPTRGVQPLGPTLDHVGPLARTVAETARAWAVLAGRRLQPGVSDHDGLRGVTVGLPTTYFTDPLDGEVGRAVESAVATVTALGGTVREVAIPSVGLSPAVQLATLSVEAFDVHRELLRTRGHLLPEDVRLRLEVGMFRSGADYARAQRLRAVLRDEMMAAMSGADVLMVPSLPILAPERGSGSVALGGQSWPVQAAVTRLTMPFNLTGFPAVSVPWCPDSRGGSIGVQLSAPPHQENKILDVAAMLERHRRE